MVSLWNCWSSEDWKRKTKCSPYSRNLFPQKLRDIAESFGDMAENREMNYCLDIAPELTWNTDLSCFNKIAGNLISNAFKYTPDKGGTSA